MIRWLPLLLLGCSVEKDPDSGTFVGNPGKMDVGVVDLQDDVILDSATVRAESLILYACDGSQGLYELGVTFDALGSGDAVDIAGGEFCGASLVLDVAAAVTLTGSTTAGTTFEVVTDPGALEIADTFRIDGTDVVFTVSLVGLVASELDALGPSVQLAPGDALADSVAAETTEGAELYEDVDANGQITADDFRLGGFDPDGPMLHASSADAGCSCQSTPTTPIWLWLLPLAALRRWGSGPYFSPKDARKRRLSKPGNHRETREFSSAVDR